jgi:hypothetical protein
MEHELINELIRLLCKAGAEAFVGNLQKEVDQDLQPERWKPNEVQEAVKYLKYINDYFGRDEAMAIITSLLARYNLSLNDFQSSEDSQKIGVGEIV